MAAVQAVRHAAHEMGQKVRIWVDANGAYSREDDFEALQALDREHLVMLEQPLPPDDVLGMIRLAHELMTPICLDESLTDDRAAQLFLESDGPRVWNIKVQRVGGLWDFCLPIGDQFFKRGSLIYEPISRNKADRLAAFFLFSDVRLGDHAFTGGRIKRFPICNLRRSLLKVSEPLASVVPVPLVVQLLIRFCRA